MKTTKEIMEGLNPDQQALASDISGFRLGIAGPGAGKTATMVRLNANMINQGIDPSNIVMFTFTNKAASEIKERVKAYVGDIADNVTIGTFHSVCLKIIRRYYGRKEVNRRDSHFQVIDDKQRTDFLKKFLEQTNSTEIDIGVSTIKKWKSNNISVSEARQIPAVREQTVDAYHLYEKRLKKDNVVDFDDIINKTVRLLENNEDVRNEVTNQFKYVIVDEAQDSSRNDLRLIKALTKNNLCLVMDDDQSIYAFRGADVDSVLDLREEYNARVHVLNTNYRSTQMIVDAGQKLIMVNKQKDIEDGKKPIIKKLKPFNKQKGPKIGYYEEITSEDEAKRIATLIKSLHENGYSYSDIGVLYRNNRAATKIEVKLKNAEIPYRIHKGLSFFDRKLVKDLIAVLQLYVNHRNSSAFIRICENCLSGISGKFAEKIVDYAQENNIDFCDVLNTDYKLNKKQREGLTLLKETLERLKELNSKDERISNILFELLYSTILYWETVKKEAESEAKTSFKNIYSKKAFDELTKELEIIDQMKEKGLDIPEELPKVVTDYYNIFSEQIGNQKEILAELEEIADTYSELEDFINNVSLGSGKQADEEKEEVSLMTAHASKGLEFKAVIVCGCNEGTFPSLPRDFFNKEVEKLVKEERRLFYVAMTRAKEMLFFTRAKKEATYYGIKAQAESRFITEIGADYIDKFVTDVKGRIKQVDLD